eukprot:8184199-Alexandrium_andersonii.AAC.1
MEGGARCEARALPRRLQLLPPLLNSFCACCVCLVASRLCAPESSGGLRRAPESSDHVAYSRLEAGGIEAGN